MSTVSHYNATGPETPGLLTTIQAAARLAVSKRHLQQLVSERRIVVVKMGKSVRFDPGDLDRFIDAHKVREVGWKSTLARKGGSH